MLFTIADVHLSNSVDKPMNVFGEKWNGYEARLCENWKAAVGPSDTVVMPGDISWGMTMEEAMADFSFLDALPGRKLIGKGNHDYWWTSVSKMKKALDDAGIRTIDFLYNCAYRVEDIAVCGTKGYLWDAGETETQNAKIMNRELARLELSLSAGKKLGGEPVVFLHYPPVTAVFKNDAYIDLMLRYGVTQCYYGHIHGAGHRSAFNGKYRGIEFSLISADYIEFYPVFIK